jgi:hypothetical protein
VVLGVSAARRHRDAHRGERPRLVDIAVSGDELVGEVAQQRGGKRVLEDPRLAVDDQVRRPGGRGGQRGSARLRGVHCQPREGRSPSPIGLQFEAFAGFPASRPTRASVVAGAGFEPATFGL